MNIAITQGVDVLALSNTITTKNKKLQAVALDQIERILIDQPELYIQIRKIFLDTTNDFARIVLSNIFTNPE